MSRGNGGQRVSTSLGADDLQLRHVRKLYGETVAVDDVSFRVSSGEFLTLLGPSGSGKTTTLLMIAGFVQPTAGTIVLGDRMLTLLPPYKRDIGMVFQHYALFPHLTIAQNIAFPLQMRKLRKTEIGRRVQAALGLVQLPDHGHRYPRELSGGQQQRIALARAIVFEPSLLLMDEPLGALDKKLREQMQLEIKRIHRDLGVTVIYVTHDQEEALVMSDRIAVFNHGRIDQLGTPAELYDRPATLFVADFLGESNFIPAMIVGNEQGTWVLKSGHLVMRASAAFALGVGDEVAVAVRPEKMVVVPPDVDIPGKTDKENWFGGAIRDVVYLGESRKYIVGLENGLTVVARQQSSSRAMPLLAPGQHVRVGWNADDCVVLPDDGILPAIA